MYHGASLPEVRPPRHSGLLGDLRCGLYLDAQLGYWPGRGEYRVTLLPYCASIDRPAGTARRGNRCRLRRYRIIDTPVCSGKSTRGRWDLGRIAGGSATEELHLMISRNASAPARPVGRTLAAIGRMLGKKLGQTAVLTVALAIGWQMATGSVAQAQSKPAAKKPAAPAAQPQAAAPQGQGSEQQQVQLIYSPWTKFCLKNPNDPNAKQVCFTGKDARIESGMPVVAAVLIEPQGDAKKILRVTLPLGMQLIHGTRVIIDQNQPMTAPYVICFTNGCMADYDATAEMIAKMKKGQGLVVQAINSTGQPISLVLPLADFAKAYDGPPTDPKVFEEQQKKLQDELQKRADEARRKLEEQQGTPGAAAAPATPPK
jgi:invasion protein IalB